MYIVYYHNYDDFEIVAYFEEKEMAKEYSELIKANYQKVETVPRSLWPNKVEYITCVASISNNKIEKYLNVNHSLDCDIKNRFWGFKASDKYIQYATMDKKEEAQKDFDEYLSKFKLTHSPTKYGTIESRFVNVEEN